MKTDRSTESYSYLHTHQRALERYGIDLDYGDYLGMNHRIMLGAHKGLQSTETNGSDTLEVYLIELKGQDVLACFSVEKQRVTTLLPMKR